jgi:hypothetical protein
MRIVAGICGIGCLIIVAVFVAGHGYVTASSPIKGVLTSAEYVALTVVALVGPAYAYHLFKNNDRHLAIIVGVAAALAMPVHLGHMFDMPSKTLAVWAKALVVINLNLGIIAAFLIALPERSIPEAMKALRKGVAKALEEYRNEASGVAEQRPWLIPMLWTIAGACFTMGLMMLVDPLWPRGSVYLTLFTGLLCVVRVWPMSFGKRKG